MPILQAFRVVRGDERIRTAVGGQRTDVGAINPQRTLTEREQRVSGVAQEGRAPRVRIGEVASSILAAGGVADSRPTSRSVSARGSGLAPLFALLMAAGVCAALWPVETLTVAGAVAAWNTGRRLAG